ncbi:ESX secretion-associated protein EspG [Rhodococcus sp. HNM0569]|uniref:ESX secretion-associated protein EspG n=1 Tax=Rhodococcus sp. HNM0569 TaxID=2716340 RepID=UPI003211EA81
MRNWRMRGAQFGALWLGTGQDRYPFPFHIVTGFDSEEARDEYQQAVRAAFDGPEHDALTAAVRILASPEIYAAVSGRTVDGQPIRAIAAQMHQQVAIAVQMPGPAPLHGGDVVVALGQAGSLGGQIVGLLPPNAGGRHRFEKPKPEAEEDLSAGILRPADAVPAARSLETVLHSGHAGDGTVRVWCGPRHARGNDVGWFRWIDVAGDGRYVVGPHDHAVAVPGGPDVLVSLVSALLDSALETVREEAW